MIDAISRESLPVELQVHIMLQLDTIDALYALIRASPRLYQVFCINKENVLSRISRRLFHPTAILEALSIARLLQSGRPLPLETALAFLHTPLEERRRRLFAITPIPQSVSMCKLDKCIRFFIDDYVRSALPTLSQLALSQELPTATKSDAEIKSNISQELSSSEFARLQRAFGHYELYSQLFSRCSGEQEKCTWSHKMIPVQEQTQLFLEKYQSFEVAEIHCVRDYLRRRLRGIYYEVEDEAVRTPQQEYYDQGYSCGTGRKSCPYPFRYHGSSSQSGHLEHLMTLGLAYLRKAIEATGDERRDLILHGADTCCAGLSDRNFITEALGRLGLDRWCAGGLVGAVNAQEELSLLSNHEDEVLVPPGWLWYCTNRPTVMPADHSARGLRDWGYVFWDHSRLEELGILDRE